MSTKLPSTLYHMREMQEFLDARAAKEAARAKFKAAALRELEAHFHAIAEISDDMEEAGCLNPREICLMWTEYMGKRKW